MLVWLLSFYMDRQDKWKWFLVGVKVIVMEVMDWEWNRIKWRWTNIFCKDRDQSVNILGIAHCLYQNHSALPWWIWSDLRQHVNEWARLTANKTLFVEMGWVGCGPQAIWVAYWWKAKSFKANTKLAICSHVIKKQIIPTSKAHRTSSTVLDHREFQNCE